MSDCHEKRNQRLGFITWMQIIGCALVILGHSYPFVSEISLWAEKLRQFIYDFHMPIFVWCSGYLLIAAKQTQKYSFATYAKHRGIRILLPYLVFSLIGIVPKVLLSGFLNDSLALDIDSIMRAFLIPRENIWGHFWFLPMIFLLGLVGYNIERIAQKARGGARICYAILLIAGGAGFFCPVITNWFALNDVVHYALYLLLGMACAKWGSLRFGVGVSVAGVCAAATGILLFILLPHTKAVSLMVSLCMIASIWMLSLGLAHKWMPSRKAIYAQTYSVFILSWPCQLIAEIVLERILHLPFSFVFPAMLITGLVAPVAIIAAIDLFERKTNTRIISKMIGR